MTLRSRHVLALVALALVAGLVFGALLTPLMDRAGARSGAASPTAGATADATTPTVTVDGEGEAAAQFDLAQVVFGVVTTGADLAQAQRDNAARTTAVLDRLKALGIAERDLQTVNYSVSPRYEGDKATQAGYHVNNSVRATVRDLNALGATIDAGIAAGANQVQGIRFDLSNRDEVLRRAREAAFNNARAKAEQYARLSGRQLGALLAVVEGGGAPQPYAMPAAARSDASAATPIQPGESTVRLTVQVRYELK